MAEEAANRQAFAIQEHYCRTMDAPTYADIAGAVARELTRATPLARRLFDWPGEPTRDALPLRLIGGLHALVLAGRDAQLAALFAGEAPADGVAALLERVLAQHETALLPWLDGPPQTNEPGRAAALMLGLMAVARRHGLRVELLEIGSSAGLNLLIGRYAFRRRARPRQVGPPRRVRCGRGDRAAAVGAGLALIPPRDGRSRPRFQRFAASLERRRREVARGIAT